MSVSLGHLCGHVTLTLLLQFSQLEFVGSVEQILSLQHEVILARPPSVNEGQNHGHGLIGDILKVHGQGSRVEDAAEEGRPRGQDGLVALELLALASDCKVGKKAGAKSTLQVLQKKRTSYN